MYQELEDEYELFLDDMKREETFADILMNQNMKMNILITI